MSRHRDRRPWGMVFMIVAWTIVCVVGTIIGLGGLSLLTADVTPGPLPATATHQQHAPKVDQAMTAQEVLRDTQFVQRYKKDQPAVARGHSDENLAMHGVLTCRMIADPRVSVTDMVFTYVSNWHNHPGYKNGGQQANHTFTLALQEICPSLLPKWKAKRAL